MLNQDIINNKHIEFKNITLQDKSIIDSFLAQDHFSISDITFGNLFIWSVARSIEFSIVCNCLVIKTTYEGKDPFFFFPIGSGDKVECLKILRQYCKDIGISLEFHSLEKDNLDILLNTLNVKEHYLNRDRSDYIYLTENLINLSGRKYHKKKNHLNRFFDEYQGFSFESISSANLSELKDTWAIWSEGVDDIGLKNEANGINNVFAHYEDLGFYGGILRYDSKIIAFSFGEVISKELCVIHIEKADIAYRGAYQAINQQLLKHCFSDITYVNREEDLGIEGLRKAKMSYYPHVILEKYEAIVD